MDVDLRDIEADLRRHQGDPQVRAKLAAARLRAAAPDPTSDPWPSLVVRSVEPPSPVAPWATSARRVLARWRSWVAYAPCERDGSTRCGQEPGPVAPEEPRVVRMSAWRSWANRSGVEVLDHGDWLGGRPISRREHEPSTGDVIVYPGPREPSGALFGVPVILVLGMVEPRNATVAVIEARRLRTGLLAPVGTDYPLCDFRGSPAPIGPGYSIGRMLVSHYLTAGAGVGGRLVVRERHADTIGEGAAALFEQLVRDYARGARRAKAGAAEQAWSWDRAPMVQP